MGTQIRFLKGGKGESAVAFIEMPFGDPMALRKSRLQKARRVSWGRTRKEARERFYSRTGSKAEDTLPMGDGFAAF